MLPPVLARRPDDSLWVLDGLHRIENMVRNGATPVSALVIDMDTAAYEARLFSAFTTSGKHLGAKERYTARYTWGDHITTAIEEVLQEFDLSALTTGDESLASVAEPRLAFTSNHRRESASWERTGSEESIHEGEEVLRWVMEAGFDLYRLKDGRHSRSTPEPASVL